MNITFIGLGKMGTALAERLLGAGFTITVFNRTFSKIAPLASLGAIASDSIAHAVKNADVIMTSLLDDQSVLDVTKEILQHAAPKTIHVGTSTILPDTAQLLETLHQQHNCIYISATVLGIPTVARKGELTTYYAGETHAAEKITPLLKSFSQNLLLLGEQIIAPNVMKICMNYSLITTIELISELYAFAEKSGLDTDLVRKGLHQIYVHPAFKNYIEKIYARDFDQVNFNMVGGNKDVKIFQDAFSKAGVAPEIGNIVRSRFTSALAKNMHDKDWSGIYEIVRDLSGLPST